MRRPCIACNGSQVYCDGRAYVHDERCCGLCEHLDLGATGHIPSHGLDTSKVGEHDPSTWPCTCRTCQPSDLDVLLRLDRDL